MLSEIFFDQRKVWRRQKTIHFYLGTIQQPSGKPCETRRPDAGHTGHFTFQAPPLGAEVAPRAGLCHALHRAEGVAVDGDRTPGLARCLGEMLQILFQVGESKEGVEWRGLAGPLCPPVPLSPNPHLSLLPTNLQQLLVLMEESRGKFWKELQEG